MMRTVATDANQLVMHIESEPAVCAEIAARRERCERNMHWLEANANEAYSHRGKYICVSAQELFVATSPEEAIRAATDAHPDDDGRFTLYIPHDKALTGQAIRYAFFHRVKSTELEPQSREGKPDCPTPIKRSS